MSGISSLSAAGSNNLFSYLTSSSKTSESKRQSDSNDAQPAGPLGFLAKALEAQGYSGTSLEDLLAKIGEAVSAQQSASGGQADPAALRDAIDKVLKDAGVDVQKLHEDLRSHRPHGARSPRPTGGESALSSISGDSDGDGDGSGNADSILQTLGVDPSQSASSLARALQNIGAGGSVDLAQLFADTAPGSLINLLA